MMTTKTGIQQVPGAKLHYEVRGSGPTLLMIAGGEGGGDGYRNVADILAERYTVVTYDRRGASANSPLDDPAGEVHLETHTDDAHRLLAAMTAEPAYVFGSSAGALIGLDLAIHWPEQIRVLVAHEPPVEGLLPEFDQHQAEVMEAHQRGDGQAAMMKFVSQIGIRYDNLEPGVILPQHNPLDAARRGAALMAYTFPAVHRYRLNVSALAAAPTHIILAGGSTGRGTLVYRCTTLLADRLGTQVVEFPSHHSGYISYPRAFAARLHEVLSAAAEG